MSKQDRQGVRTATDLERKYDFGSIANQGKTQNTQMSQLVQTLTQFMVETNKAISDIEEQIELIKADIEELKAPEEGS